MRAASQSWLTATMKTPFELSVARPLLSVAKVRDLQACAYSWPQWPGEEQVPVSLARATG